MKCLTSKLWLFVVVVSAIQLNVSEALANVYASQLTVSNPDSSAFDGNFSDGSPAMLSFFLNDTASVVVVEIVDSGSQQVVGQIDAGAMSRGANSVMWDGTGAEAGKNYVFRVTAEQPNHSTTDWTMFYDSGDIDIFSRGVAVVRNQADPWFGKAFTSNDGGPLGTGINIFNPDGSFHDPALVAADLSSSGSVDYGGTAPLHVDMDSGGHLYVSNGDRGEILRVNRDFSTTVVISGLTNPRGLFVTGSGDDLTIYVCADNQVLRAVIGAADTFGGTPETIASFSTAFPRQVTLDDDGLMYLSLRTRVDLDAEGQGIRKYDISGTLPVSDNDALWFLDANRTFISIDLFVDRGSDPTSSDDILYYCTRAEGGNDQDGIWRVDDLNSIFPDTVRIITEDDLYFVTDNNISSNATFDFDAAGNIVFTENANEHVFFISPPGEGETNSFTTTGADTFAVGVAVSVKGDLQALPRSHQLYANYPNPFNPTTSIRYELVRSGQVSLKVYDLVGAEVKTLVDDTMTAGEHSTVWDGRNRSGQQVTSGVYFVTLRIGSFIQSRRMTLLK